MNTEQKQGQPTAIPALVASKDVAKVKATLEVKYDMYVSDEFAADLIAFVEAMTIGDIEHGRTR